MTAEIIGPISKIDWRTLVDMRNSINWMKENRPVLLKDVIALEQSRYDILFREVISRTWRNW